MAIEQVTENIFYVSLPKTQHINRELEPLNDLMVTGNSYDIILDFLLIDMVTSASISTLLILHDILQAHGRQLILCNVSFVTKCELTTTGLSEHFIYADSKLDAINLIQHKSVPA